MDLASLLLSHYTEVSLLQHSIEETLSKAKMDQVLKGANETNTTQTHVSFLSCHKLLKKICMYHESQE